MENKLTPELIEKARQAQSAEELLALINENGIECSEESANAYYEQIHKSGEMSDEELSSVAGGGCYKDDYLVVTPSYSCFEWRCKKCGCEKDAGRSEWIDGKWVSCNEHNVRCKDCKFFGKKSGLMICTNPKKMKK